MANIWAIKSPISGILYHLGMDRLRRQLITTFLVWVGHSHHSEYPRHRALWKGYYAKGYRCVKGTFNEVKP